jgi:hypothetical protein
MTTTQIYVTYHKRGDDLAYHLRARRGTRALREWAAALRGDAERLLALADALDAVPRDKRGRPGYTLIGDTHSALVTAETDVIISLAAAGLVMPPISEEQ